MEWIRNERRQLSDQAQAVVFSISGLKTCPQNQFHSRAGHNYPSVACS